MESSCFSWCEVAVELLTRRILCLSPPYTTPRADSQTRGLEIREPCVWGFMQASHEKAVRDGTVEGCKNEWWVKPAHLRNHKSDSSASASAGLALPSRADAAVCPPGRPSLSVPWLRQWKCYFKADFLNMSRPTSLDIPKGSKKPNERIEFQKT